MNPFRTQPEAAIEMAPLVYYILPQAEAPIGPGDLEIEFEFELEDELDEE